MSSRVIYAFFPRQGIPRAALQMHVSPNDDAALLDVRSGEVVFVVRGCVDPEPNTMREAYAAWDGGSFDHLLANGYKPKP